MDVRFFYCSIFLATTISFFASAETMLVDDFSKNPESRWQYVSDQVMGGISEGMVTYNNQADQAGQAYAALEGQVSTENNGGFIQIRSDVERQAVEAAQGVFIRAKGNNQRYYIHIRTSGTVLPWQYYQASFDVTETWQEFKLPLESFAPSGNWLRKVIKPRSIRSIGIVAFGRDHQASVEIAEIGFF